MKNHSEAICWEKNGWMNYSFSACLQWLDHTGKKRFGERFRIYKEDHPLLYKLLVYAISDKENIRRLGMQANKGILLSGPVGCGKTTLMTLVSQFCSKEKQYNFVSAREVTIRFAREGYGIIDRYSTQSYRFSNVGYQPVVYCFDDLGTDRPIQYFGNECNVMGEILLGRYDHFVKKGMLTHATTNLSATELEKLYGNRLRSRMREMFNLVSFPENSVDKR